MVAKTKAAQIDRAMPTIRRPKKTDADIIALTRAVSDVVKATPDWGAATDVQSAVNGWTQAADTVEARAKAVTALEDQLAIAVSHLAMGRRDWRASTKHVLGTVNVYCKGSVDKVKALGFDVVTHSGRAAMTAPTDVVTQKGKTLGAVTASWSRGNVRRGFVVQHATDPANAVTYSGLVPCTKTKFTLEGAPSGTLVYFRVASVDPTAKSGIGPWSEWTPGTAA